jgi:transcriptional regulator with GAF, ATPase, and Fis domain
MLADRSALRSNAGLEGVVEALLEVIHPSPERPVEEATWLKAALTVFDAESGSAKERWLFHLEAAERLGMQPSTLWSRMKKLGIARPG